MVTKELVSLVLLVLLTSWNCYVVADVETDLSTDGSKIYELPEVTVTSRRDPNYLPLRQQRDLFNKPYTESAGLETSTSIIDREDIEKMHPYSIVDAMKYVPGAWIESRGRKVKEFFSVRGQRYPYPGYAIDGAWFREFHETNYFFNAATVDRIEILRSSSAMLLGPGDMAGIVNIIPRDYKETETQIDTIFGSNNTSRTYLSHGSGADNYSYAFGAGFSHTDGIGENARENMTDLYNRIMFKPNEDWTLSLNSFIIFGDRQLRLAEPPASTTLQTRRESYDPMTTYVFVGKARHEPGDDSSTDITANYSERRYHGYRDGSSYQFEHDYEYGVNVIQTKKLSEDNTLRYGGLFNRWISPTGKRFYAGRPANLWTYSGVIVDEHDFGRLNLNFGYRISRTYYDRFGGFGVEGSASGLTSVFVDNEWEDPLHTITFGGSYELQKDIALFGNITWGQIAATPGMLNSDLDRPDKETRTKLDLGIKKIVENLGQVALTGFYVKQDDAALLTNQDITVDGIDYGLYENGDRDSIGIELDVQSVRFENGLQFFFNATAMQTRRTSEGNWSKDREVPEFILNGGTTYDFDKFQLALFANHISPYENERFLASGSPPAPLGDFTELNAQLTYFFGNKNDTSVFARVNNIGDKHYSTVNGYPDQGRSFMIGLSTKL